MDSALWELLEEGSGEDEVAAIIRLGRPGVAPAGVRLVSRFGSIATCRLRRGSILPTRESDDVASLKAARVLAPEQEIEVEDHLAELPESFPWKDERRPPGETATGRGVAVGVVDWGCDFAHPDFRHPDGTTRLLALWDQRQQPGQRSPAPYGYGEVHMAEALNRALAAANPYAALGYHPADSETSRGAHGTHVLGIAAGNGRGGCPPGVAPEADLVFVHSSALGAEESAKLGDSVTLLEAVDFIARTAGPRPWVINLSMGRHGEPHDGTTLVEQGLDEALREAPGRAIAQSTGNYYGRMIHAAGQLRPAQERALRWEVNETDPTPNELEVWYSGLDTLEVELQSPGWDARAVVAPGEQAPLRCGGREVARIYHRRSEPNNLCNHVEIYLYEGAPPGSWLVTLRGKDVVDGRYDAWIERDAVCPPCQSSFRAEDAVVASTTGSICNGFRTIAVGAYNLHSPRHELAPFSSSGPTRDGRMKPDLVAPGMLVLAARSAPQGAPRATAPSVTRMSGTSMASPYVAGTVALMFEAAGRPLRIEETRNLLLASTRKAQLGPAEAARAGSGYCDISKAVEAARAVGRAASTAGPEGAATEASMKLEYRDALSEAALVDTFDVRGRMEQGCNDWRGAVAACACGTSESGVCECAGACRCDAAPAAGVRGWEDSVSAEEITVGHVTAGATRLEVRTTTDTPAFRAATFDEALRYALSQGAAHTLIQGNILNSVNFDVFQWGAGVVAPAPQVVEFDDTADVCALLFDGGAEGYFPSSLTASTRRWVQIPRLAEYYALAPNDQRRQRRDWVARLYAVRASIAIPGVTVERSWLEGLSMPVLRLLLAQFGAGVFPVRNINQPARQFLGGDVNGVTLPLLRYPLSEPDCYLRVIAGREGKLEAINAYDLGAGISLGPIQFNVNRGALFSFLWNLRERDRALFDAEFATPLAWSMQRHGADHYDLLINAGTPQEIALHGRGADSARNSAYFQSGDPARADFASIDAALRRNLATRFRNVVVWPHVQELIIETSAAWLAPGLSMIESAPNGIPALDSRLPDRDTFILKALLLSAYVRYSACLRPLLEHLRAWATPAEKLQNLLPALDLPGAWGNCTAERRMALRDRLRDQRDDAERAYEVISRLAAARRVVQPGGGATQPTAQPAAGTLPQPATQPPTQPTTQPAARPAARAITSPRPGHEDAGGPPGYEARDLCDDAGERREPAFEDESCETEARAMAWTEDVETKEADGTFETEDCESWGADEDAAHDASYREISYAYREGAYQEDARADWEGADTGRYADQEDSYADQEDSYADREGADLDHSRRLVELADEAVAAHVPARAPGALLAEVLLAVGDTGGVSRLGSGAASSPALIFDAFAYNTSPEWRRHFEQFFEVVALPRAEIDDARPGDILVRRAVGEGGFAHLAVLATGEVWRAEELAPAGLWPEGGRPGLYAKVVEGGRPPHRLGDQFARRLADESGRLGHDSLLLRLRGVGAAAAGLARALDRGERAPDFAEVVERFSNVERLRPDLDEWASVTHFDDGIDPATHAWQETAVLDSSTFQAFVRTELQTNFTLMRAVSSPAAGSPNYEFRIRSRIYYPRGRRAGTLAGTRAFPAALIIHGNHIWRQGMTEVDNHLGYEYLQQELARHGIISMSINTNQANILNAGIRTRAEFILANLRLLRRLNEPGSPHPRFEGRIDLHNLGLVGHSRGGDAVVKAALLLRGNADFTVRAVCSLAPTDVSGEARVADRFALRATDIRRYLVLCPSHDGDVSGVEGSGTGFRLYDRAACAKTMIFVKGLTHNRFNTEWDNERNYGDWSHLFVNHPDCRTTPAGAACPPFNADIRAADDHKQLAKEYIGCLFRLELNGEASCMGLFNGLIVPTRNHTVGIQWSFGQMREIDNFEDFARNALSGNVTYPSAASHVRFEHANFAGVPHQTRALSLDTNGAIYRSEIPAGHRNFSAFDLLMLRLANHFDCSSAQSISASRHQDFRVRIFYTPPPDATGAVGPVVSAEADQRHLDTRGVRARNRPFFHQIAICANASSGCTAPGDVPTIHNVTKIAFDTVVIPLRHFSGVNWSDVRAIEIEAGPRWTAPLFVDSLAVAHS